MSIANSTIPDNAERFVDCVSKFADNVMERCSDRYGEKRSPLLADGINPKTGEPIRWEEHILSNLGCQQHFLRTLDGLAAITGEPKYRRQAEEWIAYALSVLQDSASGMLYWGGHTSYDILEDRPLIGNHELKCVYPYYSFLHRVNPAATQFAIEGAWHKHVRDWSTLLFNRHGEYREWDRAAAWERRYKGGPLPIVDDATLSFINTGSDLIYAGALLSKLSGDEKPLLWARRLLERYDEIRDESTGLGGYQFNHREPCRVRISFKEPLSERQDVNETTVLRGGVIQTRYGRAALTWLNLFEELGASDGQDFLDMAVRDLIALGKHSYDEEDHSFWSVLIDGQRISPDDCLEGVGYCSPQGLEKVPANGLMFLTYAKAYRLTGDGFLWQMVRSLAAGMGFGELLDGTGSQTGDMQMDTVVTRTPSPSQDDALILLGLLELHRATGQSKYLALATGIGSKLVEATFTDGFFTTAEVTKNGFAKINSSLPLVLLHLAAAIEEKDTDLPTFYPGNAAFDPKVIIARR